MYLTASAWAPFHRASKFALAVVCAFVVLGSSIATALAATPVPMSSNMIYTENFADIANWTNNFASGVGASRFGGIAANTGTVPNATVVTTATTTFASGSSGGVQKGTGSIQLLSTGTTDNTTSTAIDFFMDFTGVNAGAVSFDWAEVNNSTGNRAGSLRVYASTDGTSWSELTALQALNFVNNVASGGTVTALLPSSFNNSATARLRFYYHNGSGGSTGNRPKVSIDNLVVSATSTNVNGAIAGGEYGTHTDGQNQQTSGSQVWYTTWDNTFLYVGITGANLAEGAVLYLDKTPVTPINGGTNADGTNVGNNYDGTSFNPLPFRADLAVYFKDGYKEYRTSNGSNGWSTAVTTFGVYGSSGTTREVAIPWSALGGRPASFAWFGYLTSGAGFVYAQVPTFNGGGSIGTGARYEYYYGVAVTTPGSETKPFSRNSYVFNSAGNETGFGAISVHDFTMNSSGLQIVRGSGAWTIAGDLRIDSGTIDFGSASNPANVTGGVTIGSGGALTLSSSLGGDLNLGGNWVNNGTLTPNSRTVGFTGGSPQTITGSTTFDYLDVSNSAGVTLANNVTANRTVTLGSKKITTGASTLTLGALGDVSRTSGYVYGHLARNVSGAGIYGFDIGDASSYAPATVDFTSVGGSGTLTASTATLGSAPPAQSGLSASKYVARTWTLDNSGISSPVYSATFQYENPGDLVGGAAPASLTVAKNTSGTWSSAGVSATSSNSVTTATGQTSFSDFYAGEPGCPTITFLPVAGALPGATTGAAYSQAITASPADAYTYTVTAGALPAGLTLSPAGLLSGTPTALGTANFTVTATGTGGCTGSVAYSLTVTCGTITLTPASLAGGTVGAPYSEVLGAIGGTGAVTYAVTAGALPAGLSLVAGTISGTPTAYGTYNFDVTATDANACTGVVSYSVVIAPATSTTTLAVTPASPTVYGEAVTLTATVTTGATGGVTFKDGLATLGSALISGNQASLVVSLLSVGGHTLTAEYGGDAGYAASASSGTSHTVDAASTTTSLASSPNPSLSGSPVLLTATVAAVAPGAGVPTGTVTFLDGVSTLGTGTLDGSGVATLSTSSLSTGVHALTASYATDGNYAASTSSEVSQSVQASGSNTVSAVSPAACITPAGSVVTVPVNIARTDATGIRLFHVTFQLSPELQLSGPASTSVVEGTYLSGTNPETSFLVTSNGGGSYSVDGTILGTPCGATAATGNLFNIQVTNAGGSGTGTVTVTGVTLRDCDNGNITPATAGGAASVTVDTAPVTVAAISSPQAVAEQGTLALTPSATVSACATGPLTWSISPALPAGATFNSSTGAISWTPDCAAAEGGAGGTYGPFTLTATASDGNAGSTAFSIHVSDTPGTVTVAGVTDPQSVEETATLTVTPSATLAGCATGLTPVWTISPALPAGASLNGATGEITWTPACGEAATYGPYTLTATVTSGSETYSGSTAFSIVVTHRPGTVTVAGIAPQTVGETVALTVTPSATLTACATAPLAWSISPALPAGASFNGATGEITWTPACGEANTYGPFTLTATAATGEVGTSNAFTITVTHTPGSVTVASIPTPESVEEEGAVAITPAATLAGCATGPVTWSILPALPAGASFSSSTGAITWTTACGDAGTYGPFTLTATATSGETGTSNPFSIVVTHKVGSVTVASIPTPQSVEEEGVVTVTPSATTTACAATLAWSILPALPAGASFNSATGAISWTTACGDAGTYGPFTLTATASTGEVGTSNPFSIVVTHKAGSVTVASIPTPQSVEETATLTLTPSATTTACAATLSWSISPALPAGASFNGATGEITWTPACGEANTYGPYTLTATASTGEVGTSNAFSIVVTHKPGTVTVAGIAPQTVGETVALTVTPSATLTACATAPLAWSISPALPAGASFNGATGEITWTPACGEANTYGPFTLTATAATGEVGTSNAFSITVTHTPGSVTVAAVVAPQTVSENSTLTVTPAATLAGCATGPVTWSILPALPSGASFSSSTGVITWTPACGDAASYGPFTLTATAATGETGSSNAFSIVVEHLAGTVTVASIPTPQNAAENSAFALAPSATATPCAGTLAWSISPALPAGATFNGATGAIAWTPSCGEAGTYGPFTLTATASTGEMGTSNAFSIVVEHLAGTVTVASIPTPQTVTEQGTLTVTPSATTTPCVGTLAWSISPALPAGASLSGATGVVTWATACGDAGTYGPFTLTATASTGETGSSNSFSIVVDHLTGAVAVTVADPQNVSEQALLTITPGLSTSPCVAAGTIAWSVSPALPSGASFSTSTGVITWTPDCQAAQGGAGGVYGPFTLTATAGTGETGSATFSIHVTDVPTAVAAPTGVSATQQLSGNGAGVTTGVVVHFTASPGATSYKVYRAPYGQYPEYDDAGGAVPAAPGTYPPSGSWTLTGVTADGGTDNPPSRDFWYYTVYAFNACGDASPPSALTAGTLDYHLGDVSDGVTPGTGNNVVNSADVSLLGAHYGLAGAMVTAYNYLDVGPTMDFSVLARPGTDNRIDFEDLILFAINYQVVSAPQNTAQPVAVAGGDAVVLDVPADAFTAASVTVRLTLRGTGAAQGLATQLAWNPAVVEPVSFAPGELLDALDAVALSPSPGRIDVARLGVTGQGLAGEGPMAAVTFRRVGPGDPQIRVASVEGRDASNHKLEMTYSSVMHPVVPLVTAFDRIAPNPFRANASLSFGLAQRGPVQLAIYSVDGRLVRQLVRETREAGLYQVAWDGRDESGSMAAAGVYYARLVTAQGGFTRSLVYLR